MASLVGAPVSAIDTVASVPASCSTECTVQAVPASTLLSCVSASFLSPATSMTNDVVSTKFTTDNEDGCPNRDSTNWMPVTSPTAAPTSPTATVDVIPMLAAAAAGDGTLDSEPIKDAASANPTPSTERSFAVNPVVPTDTTAVVHPFCSTDCASHVVTPLSPTSASMTTTSPTGSPYSGISVWPPSVQMLSTLMHVNCSTTCLDAIRLSNQVCTIQEHMDYHTPRPPPYLHISWVDSSKPRPAPWPSFVGLPGGMHLTEPRPPLQEPEVLDAPLQESEEGVLSGLNSGQKNLHLLRLISAFGHEVKSGDGAFLSLVQKSHAILQAIVNDRPAWTIFHVPGFDTIHATFQVFASSLELTFNHSAIGHKVSLILSYYDALGYSEVCSLIAVVDCLTATTIVVDVAMRQNSGVTSVLRTVDRKEQFTYPYASENLRKKSCAEIRVCYLYCSILELQPFAHQIYNFDHEKIGESTLKMFVFLEDLLRRAMGNFLGFLQLTLARWLYLVNIWQHMQALHQLVSGVHYAELLSSRTEISAGTSVLFIQDGRPIVFLIWDAAVKGDYTISGHIPWGLTQTAYGLPPEVIPYSICPDLHLALASYVKVWQIAWSEIRGSPSGDKMKIECNEVLIVRFLREMLLELLRSAYNLFSRGACEAHKVHNSRKISSNQLQEGMCSKAGHFSYLVVQHNIPHVPHCGGEDNRLAYPFRIWLVPWTVDGLEFTPGCRQATSQGGRSQNRAYFSDHVHVNHDYCIIFADQIPIGYDSCIILYQAYQFDTGWSGLSYSRVDYLGNFNKTEEDHRPWDPGKLVLHYHLKVRFGDKPDFKEGGMLGSPSRTQAIGPLPWARNAGVSPAQSQLQIASTNIQRQASRKVSRGSRNRTGGRVAP